MALYKLGGGVTDGQELGHWGQLPFPSPACSCGAWVGDHSEIHKVSMSVQARLLPPEVLSARHSRQPSALGTGTVPESGLNF